MNRRNFFKSIVASGLLLATASVFTGCSVSNSLLSPQETVDLKNNRIATIEFVQIQYKKGLYVMEELNFRTGTEDSVSFDTNFTLPWYVGSKINVAQNDYLLASYSSNALLESGYGLGNKIEPMYRYSSLATPEKLNSSITNFSGKSAFSLFKSILFFSILYTYSESSLFKTASILSF